MTAELRAAPHPSRLAARWSEHGWWGVVWFGVGALAGAHRLSDNSFLTHWATGRIILESGAPTVDPYSFTAGGRPWVVQSWMASWLYATLERLAGGGAIRWMVGLLTGFIVASIWRMTAPASGLVGRAVLTTLAAATGFFWWGERPQAIAFAILGACLVVLADDRVPVWLVGAAFAVWVNVHGSWPLGLLALVLVALGHAGDDHRVGRRRVAVLGWAGAGVVGGALLSPYGLELVVFPLRLLGRSENLRYIVEWRRPELSDPSTLLFVGLAGLAVWAVWRDRRWGWLPLVAIFGVLAATSRRNIPFAAIVFVPLIAPALRDLGTIRLPAPVGRSRAVACCAVMAVALGVTLTMAGHHVDLSDYPTAEVRWLGERGLLGRQDIRVVTNDYVGNYLEWLHGPRGEVFIDDRAELFPNAVVKDYTDLIGGQGDWREILARYDTDIVVWPVDSPLAGALSSSGEWEIATEGPRFLVACRVGSDAGC